MENKGTPFRALGLDMLRGIAIIGMVLAAAIPFDSSWPAWMYHAQVGPPSFAFNPDNPGITWVDLVFPFFLFSMGAAFPLAMKGKLLRKEYSALVVGIVKRGVLLLYFAIALAYLNPHNLQASPILNWITALVTFACFFMVFLSKGDKLKSGLWQIGGLLLTALLIGLHDRFTAHAFSKTESNIIILVLANMAVFGAFIWLLTARSPLLRMGTLALFAGVWFTHDVAGSWTSSIWSFHPSMHWFYQFAYLKYLCIVLPGSILGDMLWMSREKSTDREHSIAWKSLPWIGVICCMLVVWNVWTLYSRYLIANLVGNGLLGMLAFWFFNRAQSNMDFYKTLFQWGFFFLVLGLVFEPLDGGIKKDPSSFSYWFLTSGLAFFMYIVCDYLAQRFRESFIIKSIIGTGQNPMIAYSATAFLIIPILGLLHVLPFLDTLSNIHPTLALARTVLYTGLVIGVSDFATRKKWFWKT